MFLLIIANAFDRCLEQNLSYEPFEPIGFNRIVHNLFDVIDGFHGTIEMVLPYLALLGIEKSMFFTVPMSFERQMQYEDLRKAGLKRLAGKKKKDANVSEVYEYPNIHSQKEVSQVKGDMVRNLYVWELAYLITDKHTQMDFVMFFRGENWELEICYSPEMLVVDYLNVTRI